MTLSQPFLPKLVLPPGCDKNWAPGSWCKGAAVPAKPMPSAVSQSRKQDLSSYPHPEEMLLNIWRTQTSGKPPLAVISVLGTAFSSAPSQPHTPQMGAEGRGSGVGVCSQEANVASTLVVLVFFFLGSGGQEEELCSVLMGSSSKSVRGNLLSISTFTRPS